MKKLIFLFLALLFPVAIFVFLKLFGRNEFNVPVLHEEGKIDAPAHCDFVYSAPYRLADSVVSALRLNATDSLFVVYFDSSLETAIDRVAVEFKWAPVYIAAPGSFSPEANLTTIRECALLMKVPASVVLLDHQRRIRGYYDGADRDEVDRLIVEMKIILKQY